MPIDPMRRFLRKILIGDDCWPWVGMSSSAVYGYGIFRIGKRWNYYAHRFSYEQFVGPIPAKANILHTCKNSLCVRPDHLYVHPFKESTKAKQLARERINKKLDPIKYRNIQLYNYARRNGRMMPLPACSFCGKVGPTEAHHVDYSQPYLVVWLCYDCHSAADYKPDPIEVRHLAIDYSSVAPIRRG